MRLIYRYHRWLWSGFVVGAICGCHSTKADPKIHTYPSWPEEAVEVDRRLTDDPLRQQARNGEILEGTLFNYHFDEKGEELSPTGEGLRRKKVPTPTGQLLLAGKNQIQRLARKQPTGSHWHLFVEVSRDFDFEPGDDKSLAQRDDLNRQRVKEVAEFAHRLRPDLSVRVDLIDPNPVGMSAREASLGLNKHYLLAHPSIRQDMITNGKEFGVTIPPDPMINLKEDIINTPGGLAPGGN